MFHQKSCFLRTTQGYNPKDLLFIITAVRTFNATYYTVKYCNFKSSFCPFTQQDIKVTQPRDNLNVYIIGSASRTRNTVIILNTEKEIQNTGFKNFLVGKHFQLKQRQQKIKRLLLANTPRGISTNSTTCNQSVQISVGSLCYHNLTQHRDDLTVWTYCGSHPW
jgi:hypothetical protein